MPPGTGDAHLSLCQKLPLSGVVLVSTPQEVALVDARRGADFFAQVGVRVLGFVENMSYFVAPGSSERLYLFGRGGVAQQAKQAGVPLLGEVPLVQAVREASDEGTPLGAQAPAGAGEAYAGITRAIRQQLMV
jgi:ATP-binding protein involved in chromosome partitioning